MDKSLCASLMILLVVGFGTRSFAETHEEIAKKLPSDLAVLATLNHPEGFIQDFLSGLELDSEMVRECSELLLLTNPTDGTERRLENDQDFITGLLGAESIHFVVGNSRDKIGDAALLVDRGDLEITITVNYAKLYLQLASQVWNHNYQIRHVPVPSDIQETLLNWESTLTVTEGDQWLIVATSQQLAEEMKQRLVSEPPKNSLATNRNFMVSVVEKLDGAFLTCYISQRDAKRILIAIGQAKEELWVKEARDEIPWVSTSYRIGDGNGQVRIDRKSVTTSTLPLKGDRQFWQFYEPIEEFPPIPSSADSVNGKRVKLEAWHELAKKIYPEIYGEGVYESYENNPMLAFTTGISRPRMGNLKFEIWDDSSGQPQQVTFYKVDDGTPKETVLGYLKAFYTAVQEHSKNYYDLDYQLTQVNGFPAWWTDKVESKYEAGGSALVGSSDQELSSDKTENGDERQGKKSTDEKPSAKKKPSTAMGAIVIDGWVVQGQKDIVELVTDFDSGSLRDHGSNECRAAVQATLERFEFDEMHYFEYQANLIAEHEYRFLRTLLYRAKPGGWTVRNEVFDEAKKNPSIVQNFTRPQKLRFYLETTLEKLGERQPLYTRVDTFKDRLTRQVYGESWVFQKPKQGDR